MGVGWEIIAVRNGEHNRRPHFERCAVRLDDVADVHKSGGETVVVYDHNTIWNREPEVLGRFPLTDVSRALRRARGKGKK